MFQFASIPDLIIYIIEVVCCISFATSGAITALRKKADILGVVLLTLFEVFGGGLMRDLILNQGVPHIFWDPEYFFLAIVTMVISIGWFLVAYFKKSASFIEKHRHDFWIYILDALGIAAFCVSGIQAASNVAVAGMGIGGTYVLLITCGVLTGVGGGMLRDVLIGQIPTVFRKHFYMTPVIIGAFIYVLMYRLGVNVLICEIVSIVLIVVLRTFAAIYKWSLPSANGYNALVADIENKFEHNENKK